MNRLSSKGTYKMGTDASLHFTVKDYLPLVSPFILSHSSISVTLMEDLEATDKTNHIKE